MTNPDLHIVTFAVPYPANYGGAIDVWNRIKALNALGAKIHLHCFVYGLFKPHPMLKQVAKKVDYYPRSVWPAFFPKGQPYIVTSRKNKELFNNLSLDHNPILFEGIHTTGFASEWSGRKMMLRAHNVEHQYYASLANQSKGLKSLIFRRESLCLRDYEQALEETFDIVFAISPHDRQWFADQGVNTVFMPPFHGQSETDMLTGRGQYLLYQGDLSIEINQEAVLDMMGRMASLTSYPIIIAGRSGDKSFEEKLATFSNLKREADVSQEKMIDLIRNAQIILIHGLHGSGMKLKIFPALYHGRFVAATSESRTDTTLDKVIRFYEPSDLGRVIQQLWPLAFTSVQVNERKEILGKHPSDIEKAKEILRYL